MSPHRRGGNLAPMSLGGEVTKNVKAVTWRHWICPPGGGNYNLARVTGGEKKTEH